MSQLMLNIYIIEWERVETTPMKYDSTDYLEFKLISDEKSFERKNNTQKLSSI